MKFHLTRTSTSYKPGIKPAEAINVTKSEETKDWYIEINSLEELMKLAETEGNLIIDAGGTYTSGHGDSKKEFYIEPSIEIYDSCRE